MSQRHPREPVGACVEACGAQDRARDPTTLVLLWCHTFAEPVGRDDAGVEAAPRPQGTPRGELGERFGELRMMERMAR